MDNKYFTTSQVAELLAVSERTVRNLCYNKELNFNRIGSQIRISEQDLKEYLSIKGDYKNE